MKMKICYFVNSAWYFELHWQERALAVIEAGYDVYILARFEDDNIFERLTKKGFKCVNNFTNEYSLNPLSFLSSMFYCFKLLDEIEPDIVHSITIKPGVMSCIWASIKKKRLVYSFVGLGRVFEGKSIVYRILGFFVTRLYRHLFSRIKCKVLFEHKKDQDKIISLLQIPDAITEVIDGAGVDINFFSYKHELNNKKTKVLFASRMLWSKGLDTLIKVKKILQHMDVDFDLLVAGILVENDRDAISFSQIKTWHDSGDIQWLGKRADINDVIASVNIVALPSVYSEGIPRILLESGAIGRPVISFDAGGCGSLVIDGYNGYLVQKDNIEQFAEKLSLLIKNPNLRETMGRNARNRIENGYSSELVIQKTVKIYESLI